MTGMRLRTVPLLVMALAVGNGCRSGPERIDAAFEAASEAYTDAMASLGAASDLVEAARDRWRRLRPEDALRPEAVAASVEDIAAVCGDAARAWDAAPGGAPR